jgi:hypothetical protein
LGSRSLQTSLFFSATIIISNFVIGTSVPIVTDLFDEINFFDRVWRVVAGQVISIDYHDPMGSGPFQLAALLWHWLGPHYYVMRLAIALFSLTIAFCGCIVAQRTLARRADLALLFCVTLAFQLSAPTVYEFKPTSLGMGEFYNRQIMSGLAVLFLQTFGTKSISSTRENAVDVALTAILLNIMFLTKISGFLLGVMILFAGCLLQGRTVHQLLSLCAAVLVFAAITTIEFKATGLELLPMVQDYTLAAHVRLGFIQSFHELAWGLVSWPLVISLTLLVLFAVSQRVGERRLEFRRIVLIVATYAACQFALNMTNAADPSWWLAPAAMASLVACKDAKPFAWQAGRLESWWRRVSFSLAEISFRDAIPFLTFVLVLTPHVLGSIAGVALGALVSLGIKTPYVVTAGKGVGFRSSGPELGYAKTLNDAVKAIASLNLDHEVILNLDHSNPFPVLFLAPPPKGKGIYRWSDLGLKGPQGAVLESQEVIGDACVVTIPKNRAYSVLTAPLVDIVRSKLVSDFIIVYEDEFWSIYRRTNDCVGVNLVRQGHPGSAAQW